MIIYGLKWIKLKSAYLNCCSGWPTSCSQFQVSILFLFFFFLFPLRFRLETRKACNKTIFFQRDNFFTGWLFRPPKIRFLTIFSGQIASRLRNKRVAFAFSNKQLISHPWLWINMDKWPQSVCELGQPTSIGMARFISVECNALLLQRGLQLTTMSFDEKSFLNRLFDLLTLFTLNRHIVSRIQ